MFAELSEPERLTRLLSLSATYSATLACPVDLDFDHEEAERPRVRIRCRLSDIDPERIRAVAAAVNRANFAIFAGKLVIDPEDGVRFELAVPDESLTEESLPVKVVLAKRVADANLEALREPVN
jgi:hypothetical protein